MIGMTWRFPAPALEPCGYRGTRLGDGHTSPVSGRTCLKPCGITECSVWAGEAGLSLCLHALLVWPISKGAALRARGRRSPWAFGPVPSFNPHLNVIRCDSRLTASRPCGELAHAGVRIVVQLWSWFSGAYVSAAIRPDVLPVR